MMEHFDRHWLALREEFDAEARSLSLAHRLISLLPERPRLVDLGAGTGSLFRFFAPLIDRPQTWIFVDADSDLLVEAVRITAEWAKACGWTVTWSDRALLIHARSGAWRIERVRLDLAGAPTGLPVAHADAVLCSAFLDLVSASWLDQFAATLHTPFFAGINVDGRDAWLPPHPLDAIAIADFRRDQGRNKGFGRALGAHASSVALRTFTAHGFAVASAPADWRVRRSERRMARALVRGTANGARAGLPAHHAAVTLWEAARSRQACRGQLAIRIGHRDLLASPQPG